MKIEITRQQAEEMIDLIESNNLPYPLDELAIELREKFGMGAKEDTQPEQGER